MRSKSVVIAKDVDADNKFRLVPKEHEDFAQMVQFQLREHFGRTNLWVLPYDQLNQQNVSYPCLRIVDGENVETEFNGLAVQKAKEIVPNIYGDEEVYVSVEDTTVMPEGDSLKFVVDHLLSLHYGHGDYKVEYDRNEQSGEVIIYVEDYSKGWDIDTDDDRDFYEEQPCGIPNEVILFVFDKSREFRPDLTFKLSSEITPLGSPAVFARGYMPAPQNR
ncbi:MAG: hypothetical protein WC043_01590 [Pseudobdellovibrionaceae bacterium]